MKPVICNFCSINSLAKILLHLQRLDPLLWNLNLNDNLHATTPFEPQSKHRRAWRNSLGRKKQTGKQQIQP